MDSQTKKSPIVHQMRIGNAFATLSEQEKLYAHHLARAAWCGARIILQQVSAEANDIFDFVMELHRSCNGHWSELAEASQIDEAEVQAFVAYAAIFLTNLGNYYGRGDQKFVPNLESSSVDKLASVSSRAVQIRSRIGESIVDMTPHSLGFPTDATQSQYYPGHNSKVTKEEVSTIAKIMESQGVWPENTRLEKESQDGDIPVFNILQASTETDEEHRELQSKQGDQAFTVRAKRGDHCEALSKICAHLREASKYTSNEKKKAILDNYIESFTTGNLEAYRESQRKWVTDKNSHVETILGFIEPYRDPAGLRAEFQGVVAIEDPGETVVLKRFVEKSDTFIRRLPWTRGTSENNGKGPFEKNLFEAPSFASIHTLAYCSSILFDGINLPNFNDIRQTHGFKNVLISNRMAANSRSVVSSPFVRDTEEKDFKRHQYHVQYVWLVVHELLGHGTGQMMVQESETKFNFDRFQPPLNPLTDKPIESWYKPGQTWTGQFGDLATTVDECRCELVGAYLIDDKDLLALFGFDENSDITPENLTYHFYIHLCICGLTALSNFGLESKRWGQAHSRAHFAMLKCLLRDGDDCVKIDHDAEKPRLTVSVDPLRLDLGKQAMEKMLLRLHMYRVTADIESCRPYYESLSAVEDEHLAWRKTLMAMELPRLNYVHANSFLNGKDVTLKEYEATSAGIIQSWFERDV